MCTVSGCSPMAAFILAAMLSLPSCAFVEDTSTAAGTCNQDKMDTSHAHTDGGSLLQLDSGVQEGSNRAGSNEVGIVDDHVSLLTISTRLAQSDHTRAGNVAADTEESVMERSSLAEEDAVQDFIPCVKQAPGNSCGNVKAVLAKVGGSKYWAMKSVLGIYESCNKYYKVSQKAEKVGDGKQYGPPNVGKSSVVMCRNKGGFTSPGDGCRSQSDGVMFGVGGKSQQCMPPEQAQREILCKEWKAEFYPVVVHGSVDRGFDQAEFKENGYNQESVASMAIQLLVNSYQRSRKEDGIPGTMLNFFKFVSDGTQDVSEQMKSPMDGWSDEEKAHIQNQVVKHEVSSALFKYFKRFDKIHKDDIYYSQIFSSQVKRFVHECTDDVGKTWLDENRMLAKKKGVRQV